MPKLILVAFVAFALLAGAAMAGLERYDESRAGLIADGVTAAGVDLGGLEATEARARLEAAVLEPLRRPLRLVSGERRFDVDPGLLDVRVDVDAVVRSALAESREGNFLTRSFRELTGGEIDVDLPVDVEYSEDAVRRVVEGIKRTIDRPAREATSSVSFEGVRIAPSQEGFTLRARALREAIERRIARPGGDRSVALPVRRLRPKTTTADLERRYRRFVAISRSQRVLRLFVDRRLVKTYRVGIGRIGFETPAGEYRVETKAANPAWYVPNKPWAGELAGEVVPADDPSNPIKARWLGFWDGAGIHGTADEASIGQAASHGCIRMTVPDVVDLYDRVPLKTPLYIG